MRCPNPFFALALPEWPTFREFFVGLPLHPSGPGSLGIRGFSADAPEDRSLRSGRDRALIVEDNRAAGDGSRRA